MLKVAPKNSTWKEYSTACVGISLGSRNHIGPALAGILDWAGEHFEHCIIDLSDTLHRFNYLNGMSLPQAMEKSRAQGTQWLSDHKLLIDSCLPSYTLIRWDHWLEHPDFKKNLELFRTAEKTQGDFRAALYHDSINFQARQNNGPFVPDEQFLRSSIDYLLEELAAHSILYTEHPAAVIYPGKEHESFKMVRNGLVANVPDGLRNSCYTRMVIYNFDHTACAMHEPPHKTVNAANERF